MSQQEQQQQESVAGLAILDFIGFQFTSISPDGIHGKFTVSRNSCQPFGVLHGGVSAYLAEALGSIGAQVASNFERVAGIELNINHLHAVPIGQEVTVDAVPLLKGRRIQVWEVKLTGAKEPSSSRPASESNPVSVIAVSRVTVVIGLPNPSKGAAFKEAIATKLPAKL